MTDLDMTMGDKIEYAPPSEDDKRLVDSLKNMPPPSEAEPEPAEEVEEVEELKLKEVVDENVIFSEEVTEDPPSPPSKKKKPPSDKQREHLKKAREKALATRRAKAAERKKVEEAKRAERERKRIEREQKQIEKEEKDFNKSKRQPISKPAREVVAAAPLRESIPPASTLRQLTDDQIMKLQQNAIADYEKKRKAEKQKKKEAEAKANHDKKVYQSIAKAVGAPANDPWAACFQ